MKKMIKVYKNSSYKRANLTKNILYGFGLFALATVPIGATVASTLNSNLINEHTISDDSLSVTIDNQDASQFTTNVKPLVPLESISDWPLLTAKTGPIVSYGNKITALDWYGGEIWSLDTTTLLPSGITTANMTTFTNRAFINWDLDYVNSKLWFITNTGKDGQPPKQRLIKVNAITGEIELNMSLAYQPANLYRLFYKVSVLQSGKILIYGQGNEYWWLFDLYDPVTNRITNYNKQSVVGNMTNWIGGDNRMAAFFPLGNNYNLGLLYHQTSDSRYNSRYFVLLDDQFNRIVTDTSSPWYNAVLFADTTTDVALKNARVILQFYKFIDNQRTLFVFGSDIYIFWDKLNPDNSPQFQKFSLNSSEFIDSFTVDTNENLYFKFQNDTKINKITFNNAAYNTMTYSTSTYYDLSGSPIQAIVDGATRFKLYNVYRYAGQILLIEAYTRPFPGRLPPDPTTLGYPCGLQVGITSNASDPNFGDTKGLLNTADAYRFGPDFTISQSVLDSKLPSEITSNDLTLLNESFLTSNVTSSDGNLLYPPFTKKDYNDETGSFVIEVNLDQVPWFATTLPVDFIPVRVQKVFNTKDKINSRVSWKNANTDYDFINTLPSKVDAIDLKRFDPFLIDLTSQRVVNNISGEQLYPKKEYVVTSQNDATGEINIECKYTYMPLGVAIEAKNALTYNFTQSFTIFKSSDVPEFNWNAEGSGSSTTSTISNIPSLKKFTEANILPSSIKATDQNLLLEFINRNSSKGYPISKMQANIVASDISGTLSITVTLPASYYGDVKTFTHLYTGLNKLSNYTFAYTLPTGLTNLTPTTASEENTSATINYEKLLPSEITEDQLFSDFVKYNGYNSLDLNTTLIPNDANGTLQIQFELVNNYPTSVATINSFNLINGKTISNITIGNFLTTSQYKEQFVISFKNDNDKTLNSIKNLEVNTIMTALNSGTGIIIDGKTYSTKEELVELFISSKGVSIPPIKASNVFLYNDNESGLLTFELLFLENETGLSYPLSFTQTYTGFIQGVAIPTNDVFVFKNQNELVSNLLTKLPSTVALELKNNPTLIKDYFVQNVGGEFVSLISNQVNYTIETFSNDLTGTLGITVTFKNITNPQTLKLYSKSYSGFAKV